MKPGEAAYAATGTWMFHAGKPDTPIWRGASVLVIERVQLKDPRDVQCLVMTAKGMQGWVWERYLTKEKP